MKSFTVETLSIVLFAFGLILLASLPIFGVPMQVPDGFSGLNLLLLMAAGVIFYQLLKVEYYKNNTNKIDQYHGTTDYKN